MGGGALVGIAVEFGLGGEAAPGFLELPGPVVQRFAVGPQQAVEDFDLPRLDGVGQRGVDFGATGPGGEGRAEGAGVVPGSFTRGRGGEDADVVPGVGDGDADVPVAAAEQGLGLFLLAPGGEAAGGDPLRVPTPDFQVCLA